MTLVLSNDEAEQVGMFLHARLCERHQIPIAGPGTIAAWIRQALVDVAHQRDATGQRPSEALEIGCVLTEMRVLMNRLQEIRVALAGGEESQ